MCCETCIYRNSCANAKPPCYVPKPYWPDIPVWTPQPIYPYSPYIPYSPTTIAPYPLGNIIITYS